MSFAIKEFITDILDSGLEDGEKLSIISQLYDYGRVSRELYLRRSTQSNNVELCLKNKDNSYSPTNYTSKEIIKSYQKKPTCNPVIK